MSETKISEAEEALRNALKSAYEHGANHAPFPMVDCVFKTLAAITVTHPQPAELAEQQGDAPEIEQLRKLVSSILSTVSLGHQTGPHAYAGEDFGRYLHESASDCRTILRMLPTLAATGKQQVGEVQGDALASLPLYRLADDANGNRGLHRDDTGSWVKLQDVERALAARQPWVQVPVSEAWIVVKQYAWDHGDGGRPTLAYLWPSEFERRVYPSFAAASEFIKAGGWPLGFVAMQIEAPPAQGIDLGASREQEILNADLRAILLRISESQPGDSAASLAQDALALIDQRDAAPGVE